MTSKSDNSSRAEFFNIFTARFDADLLDITDKRAVETAIQACTFDTLQRVEDIQSVVSFLEEVIKNWSGQNIAPFIEATGQDWLLNEQTERILKFVIQAIAADLGSSAALPMPPS